MAINPDPDLASVLEDILRTEGSDVIENRSRLASLLRERAPDHSRAVHLLLTALDAGVPTRLRARGSQASEIEIGQEAAQMVDNFGSSAEHARTAVETWAKSLARAVGESGGGARSADRPARRDTPVPNAIPPVQPSRSEAVPGDAAAPIGPGPLPMSTASPSPLATPAGAGAARPAPVQPLPLPAAKPTPVQPSPPPSAGPVPVRPLPGSKPASVQPLPPPATGAAPVQPLPLAATGTASVQPMPLPADGSPSVQPLPSSASARLPSSAAQSGGVKWAVILPVVAAAIAGGLWASGYNPFSSGTTPPRQQRPADPASPASPSSASGKTDEGFEIADREKPPKYRSERLDGDPNSLLYAFGLRVGEQTFTYQVAVAFTGAGPAGAGLIKVVKAGREASTGQVDVVRSMQDNGYVGFNVTGSLKSSIGAPSICAATLAGRTPGRLDISNGGGFFCAFGTSATGLCTDNQLGCGSLE